jgi:hypothetical protein
MYDINSFQIISIGQGHEMSVGYEVHIVERKDCSSCLARRKGKRVDASAATVELNIHKIYRTNGIR